MQSQTSDNSGLNKLKSLLFLALSCNQTSILGCILTWIILSKNEFSSFWNNILIIFCLLPVFMGDAISCYVLGRIRLEHQNSWDDICMTSDYKAHISKFYNIYRAISIITSYGLAYMILSFYQTQEHIKWVMLFVLTGGIYFLGLLLMMLKGIVPIVPQTKRKGVITRIFLVFISLAIWWGIQPNYLVKAPTLFFVLTSSIVYFVISGMMHPLPTRNTILESVIRESILSQARAVAQARAYNKDQVADYSQKTQDIEDAAIIATDSEKSEDLQNEVKKEYVNTESDSRGILPDAIIVGDYPSEDRVKNEKIDESDAEIISVETKIKEQ